MTTTTEPAVTDLDSVLNDLIGLRQVYHKPVPVLAPAPHGVPVVCENHLPSAPDHRISEVKNLRSDNRQVLAESGVLATFSALDRESFEALWQGARDIIRKGARYDWSPKQGLVVVRALTPKPAADPNEGPKVDCPEGRVAVSGVVVSVKQVVDHFRSNRYHTAYTWKWVVCDDSGFKVWGTVPGNLTGRWLENENRYEGIEELVGKRVSFTATITRSDRDASFGFAKRPSKTEVAS